MIDPGSAAYEFLQQADETLEEARILVTENHPPGAINRSYYAAFYAACALLDSVPPGFRSGECGACDARPFYLPVIQSRYDEPIVRSNCSHGSTPQRRSHCACRAAISVTLPASPGARSLSSVRSFCML